MWYILSRKFRYWQTELRDLWNGSEVRLDSLRLVGSTNVRLLCGRGPAASALEPNEELLETVAEEGRRFAATAGGLEDLESDDLLESTLAVIDAKLAFVLRVRDGVPGADFGYLSAVPWQGIDLPFREAFDR